MNRINYLSIAKTPYELSFAVFNGVILKQYGRFEIDYLNSSIDIFDKIESLVKLNNIDIVVSNEIDIKDLNKQEIEKISEFKSLIKTSAIKNNAIYAEFRTYGWEKRILFNRITPKQKIDTINFAYDIELNIKNVEIANAIILGEGVAHNRLQIGSI